MVVNPHDVLGIPRGSSKEVAKKAFRNLALKWHPDRNGGSEESQEKFKEIANAYEQVKCGVGEIHKFSGFDDLYSSLFESLASSLFDDVTSWGLDMNTSMFGDKSERPSAAVDCVDCSGSGSVYKFWSGV